MNPEAPVPASRRFVRSSDALDFPSPQNSIAPIPPPVIPDHELIRLIGRGSYGQVWLAKNAVGTLRAVKVVYRATFEKEEHFEREFKGLEKFEPISRSHDGFVDILLLGRNDPAGYFYYIMELAATFRPKVPARRRRTSTVWEKFFTKSPSAKIGRNSPNCRRICKPTRTTPVCSNSTKSSSKPVNATSAAVFKQRNR